MKNKIKGFKGFDKDFKCRDKQYKENEIFEEKVTLKICNQGIHFCEKPLDVFNRKLNVILCGSFAYYFFFADFSASFSKCCSM